MTVPSPRPAGAPAVSVCIPTYGRPDALAACLAAVTALATPDGGFEVIVADDGSPDPDAVRAVVDRVGHGPVPVRLTRLAANRGPGAARNAAWRLARGDWVAFTDDDCRPDPRWLVALAAAAAAAAADVVQGRTLPDPAGAHLLDRPFARSMRVEEPSDYFPTCNIAYRRSLLERLGGFDEMFRLIADDTDLGWRASEAGARVAFAADAVVHHRVVVGDWRSDLRSRRRWADVVRMVGHHPAARRLAWRPYVYRPSHVVPLLLLGTTPALLGRRSRRAWAGLLAAIVARDLVRAPDLATGRQRALSRLGDAYETLLLLRASVEQRTLLL